MTLSNKGDGGVRDGGPATPPEPHYTIYECVYPDTDRRRSGEPADEAISRAFFENADDAESFARHNGGTVHPQVIPKSQRERMRRLRLLPGHQPRHWGPRKRKK